TISAGASGAIFGLFGVLLAFGIRYRDSLPPFVKRAVGTGVLPVIVINPIIGFTIPEIDNSAHIAGLLAGAALAAVIPFQKPRDETPAGFRSIQIALLAMIAVCFYEVGVHYDGPRLSVRNLARGLLQIGTTTSSTGDFIEAINAAQKTFEDSTRQIETGRLPDLTLTRAEISKSIDRLRNAPSLAARSDELVGELLRVMEEQYDLLGDIQETRVFTLAHAQRLKANTARYRKEATGNLEDVKVRDIDEQRQYYAELEARRATILNSIEKQEKLTEDLRSKILACFSKSELEDLYLPYKPKRKTKAAIAVERGLEPLADYLWEQTGDQPAGEFAERFINLEKEILTIESAIEGALHIIAERVAETPEFRKQLRDTMMS